MDKFWQWVKQKGLLVETNEQSQSSFNGYALWQGMPKQFLIGWMIQFLYEKEAKPEIILYNNDNWNDLYTQLTKIIKKMA